MYGACHDEVYTLYERRVRATASAPILAMPTAAVDEENLIAERKYTIGENGEHALTIRLARPIQLGPGRYRCDFQFVGSCENHGGSVIGIDAINAIDSAFWMMGSKLAGLNESVFDSKLTWEAGVPERPLGLPVIKGEKFRNY